MEHQDGQQSYLAFKLGKETFASNVNKVLSIVEVPKITKMPQTPDYMVGVMNLRGEVIPVIDIRIKFGMEPAEITTNTCVLILEIELENRQTKIGALVDSVEEVLEIDEDSIKPSPLIGTKYSTVFITGMVQKNEGFIMILNVDNVFTDNEIISLQHHLELVEEC
jgi:purine-binding chemotaxis protein CheW